MRIEKLQRHKEKGEGAKGKKGERGTEVKTYIFGVNEGA
jgi:hypothetical protein